jgi:transcriptional regulator with XRE-family HTH domain
MKLFKLDQKGIGADLKRARQFLGLTLKEVSAASGVARSHIWNLERGAKEMSLEKFFSLCVALAISPADAIHDNIAIDAERVYLEMKKLAFPASGPSEGVEYTWMVAYVSACVGALARMLLTPGESRIPGGLFEYPTDSIRTVFGYINQMITVDLSLRARFENLRRLAVEPVAVLREFDLLSRDLVGDWMEYVRGEEAKQKGSDELGVWNGTPKKLLGTFMRADDETQSKRSQDDFKALFAELFKSEAELQAARAQKISGNDVDSNYVARNDDDMKSELPGILKQLAALTKPRGMKASLAFDLGVPASRISEWLKRRGTPTADVALKLRRWVESPEAQKTTAARCITIARPKTQVRKSTIK